MTDNTSLAVAYYLNGAIFQASAKKLQLDIELDSKGCPTKLTAIPLYFLASHAAELFLKAALLKRGFNESQLKKFDYRHNLEGLLLELLKKGVPVSDETKAIVNGLSAQHKKHALRYTVLVDDGETTYSPPLSAVFSALDELLMATRLSTYGV